MGGGSSSPKPVPVPKPVIEKAEGEFDRVRVAFFGESGAGKSQLVNCLVSKQFVDGQGSTVGTVEERVPLSAIDPDFDGKECLVQLNDMSGQEKYRHAWATISKSYDMSVLVVDSTSVSDRTLPQVKTSLIGMLSQAGINVIEEKDSLEVKKAERHKLAKTKFMVVFTKYDLIDKDQDKIERVIETHEMIYSLFGPLNIKRCVVSCKTGFNMTSLKAEMGLMFWQEKKRVLVENKVKIVLIGPPGVGKTMFIRCASATDDKPIKDDEYIPNVGVDLVYLDIKEGDKTIGKVQMWDTAGVEDFSVIPANFLKGAKMILVVYDARMYAGELKDDQLEDKYKVLREKLQDDSFEQDITIREIYMKADLVSFWKKLFISTSVFFSKEEPKKIKDYVISIAKFQMGRV